MPSKMINKQDKDFIKNLSKADRAILFGENIFKVKKQEKQREQDI